MADTKPAGFIPDDEFTPDSGFISDDDFVSDEDKYDTTLEEVKATAEGALRGASFGLSDQFLTKAGITTPEAMKARKEASPVLSGAGELAGVVGPSLLTGGATLLPGIAERVGVRAAESLAARGAGAVATKAAALGTEGALYGVGQAVSENALGDHDLVSQESLADVGLGAILGAGLGGIAGKFISPKALSSIDDISSAEAKLAAAKMADAPIGSEAELLSKIDIPAKDKIWLLDKAQEQIPGAGQMKKEFNEEGLPFVTGMFSKNKTVRDWASAIGQSATLAGNSIRESIASGFSKIEGSLGNIFESNAKREAGEAGDLLKKHILDEFEKRNAPFKELYAEREAMGKAISLGDKDLLTLHDDLMKGAKTLAKYEGSQAVKSVEPFADLLLKQPNLSAIDGVISAAGEAQRKAYRDGSFEAAKALGDFVERSRDFVNGYIEKTLTKEGGSEIVIMRHKETTKAYKKFKDVMSDLVADTKLGKKAMTASGLQEALEKIPNEKFLDKIFDSKNSAALQRLRDEFPEVFGLLAQQKRAGLFAKAMEKDVFNPKQLIKMVNDESKMSRGVRDLLFTKDQVKKMEVYQKWIEKIPSKVGPSGTPEGLEYMNLARNLLNPVAAGKRLLEEASTAGGKKIIDSILTPGERSSIATLRSLDTSAKSTGARISHGIGVILGVGKKSAKPLALKIPGLFSENEYEETTEKIREAANNPQLMLDNLSASTDALYPYAPNVTQSIQGTVIRGIQFLNSKIPPDPVKSIFHEKQKPSKHEMARFQRYYDIVQDPILALKQVKDGSISPETIETLSVVWPKLYDRMKVEMLEKIAEHEDTKSLPYHTKLSIGQFLGQPVVPSLQPMAIMANQQIYAHPELHENAKMPMKRTRKTDFEASNRMGLGRKDSST